MQDYNDNIILDLYVTPEKPIVSYLTPLTGCVLNFIDRGQLSPSNGLLYLSSSPAQSAISESSSPEHV